MSLLESFIQDLNQMETAKRSKQFARIRSIDFVKGLAICLIMLAHTGEQWISADWRWAHAILFPILDVFGPSLFIFLSALSVVFSCKKRECIISENVIRKGILIRAVVIIALGVLINLATSHPEEYPFPMNLWGWNILMFIGFSQIFCYYSIKLSRELRIVLGFLIVFLTDPMREYMILNKDTNPIVYVIHYIVVSPAPHNPLFPYIALAIFSTIFGEMIFEAMIFETPDAYKNTFLSFIKAGIIFTLIGVIMGWDLVAFGDLDASDYIFMDYLPIIGESPYFDITVLPRFIIRGTAANQLYSLGMAIIILGIAFYYIDYKNLKNPFHNHVINIFVFLGRVSLSLFFIHFLFILLYFRALNVVFFFPVMISWIGFLALLMAFWNKEADGIGSFEWLITQMGGKKKKKKPNKYV